MDAIRNGQHGKVHLANLESNQTLCGIRDLLAKVAARDWWYNVTLGRSMRHVMPLATCKSCIRIGKEWAQ